MKMRTNKYLTMAVTALMMAACSSEDVPQVDSVTNTPIRIHAMVAELESRAGIDDNTDFSQFYLSVKNSSNSNYSYSNVEVTNSGSEWVPEETMYWQNSTTEVTVTAATFSLNGAQNLEVKTDQSTDINVIASDHLYMAATSQSYAEVKTDDVVTKATGAINVNFSHLMSKVNLTITLADEFDYATNPISNVTFQGTVASRSYIVGTGWDNIPNNASATDITACGVGYTKPKATYEVILVPQTIAAGNFAVQFQIDGRLFKWTSANAVTLESGKQYTLALTAGDDKVSGASFSSTAWGNVGNYNVATE